MKGSKYLVSGKERKYTLFSITRLYYSPHGINVKEREKSFESPYRNYCCFKKKPAVSWLCKICIFLDY